MEKNIFKKAFTLAEIMIVLTIIGVLTAILLPSAFHATPDENVLKFKKSNSILYQIIGEVVTSGKYYKTGDLRYKADGETETSSSDAYNYMCQVIAETVSSKDVDCSDNGKQTSVYYIPYTLTCTGTDCDGGAAGTCCTLENVKSKLDSICSSVTSPKGVTTTDDVIWYEAAQTTTLGDPDCTSAVDCNNIYKVFCLKIDTLYFGYGIRSDGKIIASENVDDYVAKSVQE